MSLEEGGNSVWEEKKGGKERGRLKKGRERNQRRKG